MVASGKVFIVSPYNLNMKKIKLLFGLIIGIVLVFWAGHCINKYFPKSKCVMDLTPIECYFLSYIKCYCYETHCEEDYNAPCVKACEDWKKRNCTVKDILPKQVFVAYDCDAKMDCKCVKDLYLKGIPIVKSYQENKSANFTVIMSGKHVIALKNTGNVTLTNIGIYLSPPIKPEKFELFRVFISLEPNETKDIMGGVGGIITPEMYEKYKPENIMVILINCSQGIKKKFYLIKHLPTTRPRW